MPDGDSSASPGPGGTIAGVSIGVGAFLLVLAFMCSLCQGNRASRHSNAATHAAAGAAPSLAARPPAEPAAGYWDDDDDERSAREERGRPPRASPTAPAGLPSFAYNPSSVKKHGGVTGEESAATCSVCLGAFQAGETVRLLPVCLHLYHVECIDPWLDAHPTCPICRSGTDPQMDGGLLPPV